MSCYYGSASIIMHVICNLNFQCCCYRTIINTFWQVHIQQRAYYHNCEQSGSGFFLHQDVLISTRVHQIALFCVLAIYIRTARKATIPNQGHVATLCHFSISSGVLPLSCHFTVWPCCLIWPLRLLGGCCRKAWQLGRESEMLLWPCLCWTSIFFLLNKPTGRNSKQPGMWWKGWYFRHKGIANTE